MQASQKLRCAHSYAFDSAVEPLRNSGLFPIAINFKTSSSTATSMNSKTQAQGLWRRFGKWSRNGVTKEKGGICSQI